MSFIAKCHPDRKAQARGLCKSCYDKWLKENNPEYKKAQQKNTADWVKSHPEEAKKIKERRKEKLSKDPMRRREIMLKKKYGITQADYEVMLKNQNGGCAICSRKPKEGGYLHVDHCHATGKVRGLLCHQCNWYLGTIEDGDNILDKIIKYLSN